MAKITPGQQEFLRAHFAGVTDWDRLTTRSRAKGFVDAVEQNPFADKELRKYVRAMHLLQTSPTTATVPSLTSGKSYRLRKLPSGRIGCTCADWRYKKSHKGGDCKHVRAYKAMEKTAADYRQILQAAKRLNPTTSRGLAGQLGATVIPNKRIIRESTKSPAAFAWQKDLGLEGLGELLQKRYARYPCLAFR